MPRKRTRRPTGPVTLKPDEVAKMRVVGQFASSILDRVEKMIEPGLSTEEIDRVVDEMTTERGAVSGPYGYPAGSTNPFPGHCCTSVNSVVCHGIPSESHILREGDIINVDVTPILDGYHGDTSRTFLVGDVDPEARRLVDDTFEAMRRGIAVVKPGGHVGDIGNAIQDWADERGHGVVTEFAGHGIGRIFHGPPTVNHGKQSRPGYPFVPGMTFTVEPMLNAGRWKCMVLSDRWTAVTQDGSLSAQFEHTVTVTETGVEVLTLGEDKTLDLTLA